MPENADATLWKDLQIDFHLEGLHFPDDKIYGVVKIIPESSRKLIDHFNLIINGTNRIKFDSNFETLAAAGFKTNKKYSSVSIEATPRRNERSNEVKTSSVCYFYCTGETFTSSPVISFDWLDGAHNEKPTPILIIRWHHIGDKNAHQYILYLDNKEVQYIRQALIDDSFKVQIRGLESNEKHTFQLGARLTNGKQTYLSDLIEFTVPVYESTKEIADGELITITNEPMPSYLPVVMATDEELEQIRKEESPQNQTKNSPNLIKRKDDLVKKLTGQITDTRRPTSRCCDHLPHTTFPGIEHYFINRLEQLSDSRYDQDNRSSSFGNSRVKPSEDDDDDVITSNNEN